LSSADHLAERTSPPSSTAQEPAAANAGPTTRPDRSQVRP
jgi:hypothetical protein